MRIALYIAIIFVTTWQADAFAQGRVVINNDAYITMQNGAYLVIDNESGDALVDTGSGANILMEGEGNMIRWMIGDGLDTYAIPFTAANGDKIPMSVDVTAVGSQQVQGESGFNFSTYQATNSDNTPYPTEGPVLSMNDLGGNDISLTAVDRFWIIDRDDYFLSPDMEISFGYSDDASEIGGSNTISESHLKGFAYDEQNDMWGRIDLPFLGVVQDTSGSADTLNNVVSGVLAPASAVVSYKIWTLATGDVTEAPTSCNFNIYKMFTPDGDEKNDTWIIDCIDQLPNNKVTIVNRWGDEVASFEGYDNTSVVWDGKNKGGELLTQGTYFYVVQIEDNGETHSGWVQLVY